MKTMKTLFLGLLVVFAVVAAGWGFGHLVVSLLHVESDAASLFILGVLGWLIIMSVGLLSYYIGCITLGVIDTRRETKGENKVMGAINSNKEIRNLKKDDFINMRKKAKRKNNHR